MTDLCHIEMSRTQYQKRAAGSILLAWLIFLGIDFLFHASLLQSYWSGDIEAILDEMDLFKRIPLGYGSFLVLTILVYYLLIRIQGKFPEPRQALVFGFVFGGLYSFSNFLGLYSYTAIPVGHLLVFNIIYFIELIVVSWLLSFLINNLKKSMVFGVIGIFFLLIILGLLLQNM